MKIAYRNVGSDPRDGILFEEFYFKVDKRRAKKIYDLHYR